MSAPDKLMVSAQCHSFAVRYGENCKRQRDKLAALLSEARSIISASSCSNASDEVRWYAIVDGWMKDTDAMLETLGD